MLSKTYLKFLANVLKNLMGSIVQRFTLTFRPYLNYLLGKGTLINGLL
jgi:hypothetical protein